MSNNAEKILAVTSVDFSLLKKLPPEAVISANGTTGSPGWTSPSLSPYVYITPPADGIQEFDFLAVPPENPSIQVPTPIGPATTSYVIPQWCLGFRVTANTNSIQVS